MSDYGPKYSNFWFEPETSNDIEPDSLLEGKTKMPSEEYVNAHFKSSSDETKKTNAAIRPFQEATEASVGYHNH